MASHRQILRLGEANGTPYLFAERAYIQNHAIEGEVASQVAALVSEQVSVINASLPQKGTTITFPEPRNPGGVYSDSAGGVMTGEYSTVI